MVAKTCHSALLTRAFPTILIPREPSASRYAVISCIPPVPAVSFVSCTFGLMNLDCTVPAVAVRGRRDVRVAPDFGGGGADGVGAPGDGGEPPVCRACAGRPGRSSAGSSIEVVAALITAGAAWTAIGRMVDTREPSAGI
jgi:hypothetical protein